MLCTVFFMLFLCLTDIAATKMRFDEIRRLAPDSESSDDEYRSKRNCFEGVRPVYQQKGNGKLVQNVINLDKSPSSDPCSVHSMKKSTVGYASRDLHATPNRQLLYKTSRPLPKPVPASVSNYSPSVALEYSCSSSLIDHSSPYESPSLDLPQ